MKQGLLERAAEMIDRREASALSEWMHYRCPRPGVLVAPEREVPVEAGAGVAVVRPIYELDLRGGRCSCPDQRRCDRINAELAAAGIRSLWVRCKHHRIAQLISVWRWEMGGKP